MPGDVENFWISPSQRLSLPSPDRKPLRSASLFARDTLAGSIRLFSGAT